MNGPEKDDFYVGYFDQAPPVVGAFVKGKVLLLLVLVAGVAALVALAQGTFAPAVFEFGNVRDFEGVIATKPYPMLRVSRPGESPGEAPTWSRYFLVDPFKFGADDRVANLDGKRVRLSGTLVYRDDQTMIEIDASRDIQVLGVAESGGGGLSFGTVTLVGEIVDSKCFLGVMNPGELKPHKACAVRCVSGGMPPVLVVRDGNGAARYFMLADTNGGQVNDRVLDLIAEPVRIQGEMVRMDNLWVLKADPATYQLVN